MVSFSLGFADILSAVFRKPHSRTLWSIGALTSQIFLHSKKNKDFGELIDIFDELYEDETPYIVRFFRTRLTEILHRRGYFTCTEIKWNRGEVEEENEPTEESCKGVRKIVDLTGKNPTVYNCPFCSVFTITADGTMNSVGFPRGYCSQCGREFTLPKECEEATK